MRDKVASIGGLNDLMQTLQINSLEVGDRLLAELDQSPWVIVMNIEDDLTTLQ